MRQLKYGVEVACMSEVWGQFFFSSYSLPDEGDENMKVNERMKGLDWKVINGSKD